MNTDDEPPGNYLRALLIKHAWTQTDLSTITGFAQSKINNIVTGKRKIKANIAKVFAAAFSETTPEYWMQLQTNYDLRNAK